MAGTLGQPIECVMLLVAWIIRSSLERRCYRLELSNLLPVLSRDGRRILVELRFELVAFLLRFLEFALFQNLPQELKPIEVEHVEVFLKSANVLSAKVVVFGGFCLI